MASARRRAAAAAAGTFYCASHGSVCRLEDIAATDAQPCWIPGFVYTDRGFTREMIERAAAAPYDVLVLTVDNQLLGNRERDIRNGFSIRRGSALPARSAWRARRHG